MKITNTNNFMRIFKLPTEYPEDFCFGGGIPVTFQMVDWFSPVPDNMIENFNIEKHRKMIRKFVKEKIYFTTGYKYLAIADYGDTFLIE